MKNFLAGAIEIAFLAGAIYLLLRFLRATRGSGFVRGLLILVLFFGVFLRLVIEVFSLTRLELIYDSSLATLVIVLAVLFQPELRRGISRLGEHPLVQRVTGARPTETVAEVCRALAWLSREKVGALVAFERDDSLEAFAQGGVPLDARVDHLLLEAVFQRNGPLHDGAVVIRRERIAAAACLFPLTDNPELSKRIGTRHRAALGITEETDAVAVVVSEETGGISLVERGKLRLAASVPALERDLRELLSGRGPEGNEAGFPVPAS